MALVLKNRSNEVVHVDATHIGDSYCLEMRDCQNVVVKGGCFDVTQATTYPTTDAGIVEGCYNCRIEGATFIGSGHWDRQCLYLFMSQMIEVVDCTFIIPAPREDGKPYGKRGVCVAGDFCTVEGCCIYFAATQYGPEWPASSDGNSSGITIYGGAWQGQPIRPTGNRIVGNNVYGPTAYGIGVAGGRRDHSPTAYATGNWIANNHLYCHADAYAGLYATNRNDNGESHNMFTDNLVTGAQCAAKNHGTRMVVDGLTWIPHQESGSEACVNDVSHEDFIGTLSEINVHAYETVLNEVIKDDARGHD